MVTQCAELDLTRTGLNLMLRRPRAVPLHGSLLPSLAFISRKMCSELMPHPSPASCFSAHTGADVIITYYTPLLLQWLKE